VAAVVLVPGELVVGPDQPALPGGSTPDGTWERPLVGSGTEDRHSLAALQWQGTEKLREITVTGRPVTLNGVATRPEIEITTSATETAEEEAARKREEETVTLRGGPMPSSVADGLSADGLVQRRRRRRPVDLASADATPLLPPAPAQQNAEKSEIAELTAVAEALATRQRPTPQPSIAQPAIAPPASAQPAIGQAPTRQPAIGQAARGQAAVAPLSPARPAGTQGAADQATADLTTEDGLPKRVRQANLAPQLRRPAGALPDEPTVPLRSPEQVRSIMSALQSGTTRGRSDAARLGIPKQRNGSPSEDRPKPEKNGNGGSAGGTSFADAATVSFPAIATTTGTETPSPGTPPPGDGQNPEHSRPEKDA
jgi:hypothetical protein